MTDDKKPKVAPLRRISSGEQQLDMFFSYLADVPFRDEKDAMSMPMLSLAKRKRVEPINWTSSDGKSSVTVTAPEDTGMATIHDYDILIWAISQMNQGREEGRDISPHLSFHPYELLKATGRGTGGLQYDNLKMALNRLTGTLVMAKMEQPGKKSRRFSTFHWIEAWQADENKETGEIKSMEILLPKWVVEGVEEKQVLAISADYFKLTSGIERWLYRLARRHAGKQDFGFRFTMQHLHTRSGSTNELKYFARSIRKIVEKNNLPEYSLKITKGQKGDELVEMVLDNSRMKLPAKRTLKKIEFK